VEILPCKGMDLLMYNLHMRGKSVISYLSPRDRNTLLERKEKKVKERNTQVI